MRPSIAALIVSFGLTSFAASANNIQLSRRQLLVGAGTAASSVLLPKDALALAKFGASSPLLERVQLFMTDMQFRHNVFPQWLEGQIGDFVFNSAVNEKRLFFQSNLPAAQAAVREMLKAGGMGTDISLWKTETVIEEAAYSTSFNNWWERAAIEVVEGELEVSRILKLPLEAVQTESNYFLHLSKYVRPQDTVITPAVIDTAPLGREFLKTYLEVLGRRLPGFNTSLAKSIRFYSYFDGLPNWMAEYQGHLASINAEVMGVEAQAVQGTSAPAQAMRSTAAAVEEEAPGAVRASGLMQQLSSRIQNFRQSCANLMDRLDSNKARAAQSSEISSHESAQLPAPENTLPGQSISPSDN